MNKTIHSANSEVGKYWSMNLSDIDVFPVLPYTQDDKNTWELIFGEHIEFLEKISCVEHLAGYKALGITPNELPEFKKINLLLQKNSSWRLIAVDGLVENHHYFELTAQKIQPFSPYIREKSSRYNFKWPDIFHELCHLPPLLNKDFSALAKELGRLGKIAYTSGNHSLFQKIARLYWHIIEYGSQEKEAALVPFGALLCGHIEEYNHIASHTHLVKSYISIEEIANTPLPWELESDFVLDNFQKNYFCLPSFAQLSADFNKWAAAH